MGQGVPFHNLTYEQFKDLAVLSAVVGPTTGNVYFVDSGKGIDADGKGTSSDAPYATIDYAVGRCNANNGDVVVVMPGHAEDLAAGETIDADVAGVKIVGLGWGSSRPRIDYDGTTASFDIGASGVWIENLTFRPSVATVAIGIDIEAAVTDTMIKNCEFLQGEAGDGTDEFVIGIDIKAGCTNTTIDGVKYRHNASANGAASCIKLTGASDSVTIKNCDLVITGAAAVACINGDTTLSTRIVIDNCMCTSDAEPGIELLTGTTGIIKNSQMFTDLATIDASTVADACAHFDVKYVEVGNEAGTLVKTESADD